MKKLICLFLTISSYTALASDSGSKPSEPQISAPQVTANQASDHKSPSSSYFPYIISLEALLSVPQPLEIGVCATPKNLTQLQIYLDAGYFQYPFGQTTSVGISETSVETGVRYYPTKSWWDLSLGVGYRNILLTTSQISAFNVSGTTLATSAQLGLEALYISPMIEAKVRLSKRASLGFGLGVQLALFGSGSVLFQNSNNGTNSNNSNVLDVNAGDYLGRIAEILVPRVTLIRFTWDL